MRCHEKRCKKIEMCKEKCLCFWLNFIVSIVTPAIPTLIYIENNMKSGGRLLSFTVAGVIVVYIISVIYSANKKNDGVLDAVLSGIGMPSALWAVASIAKM